MLLILRSTALSWASTTASPLSDGPVAAVPPAPDLPEPVVADDPLVEEDPEELAVPALLVPGGVAAFAELPTPLGSLPELLRPPALAGPDGTPLTLPVPAEPVLAEPVALPEDAPLLAPPALPPLDWANELTEPIRMAMATIDAVMDILVIENLPL